MLVKFLSLGLILRERPFTLNEHKTSCFQEFIVQKQHFMNLLQLHLMKKQSQGMKQHQIACHKNSHHTLSILNGFNCAQLHSNYTLLILFFQQKLSCFNFIVKSLKSDVS